MADADTNTVTMELKEFTTEYRVKGDIRPQIYVAGPMRGIPQFNFPAFFAAHEKLEAEGWKVWNPAKKDEEQYGDKLWKDNKTGDEKEASANTGFSLRDALKWDTEKICQCDAIAMLPGWEKSNGAFAEWALARALGLEVKYL